jgi:uncharacterized phiE125 gp8 family phage protein
MNYTLKTAPTIEPVDLALAKVQCRIEPDVVDEDGVLAAYIAAARSWVEDYTGRPLMTQTWQMSLPDFPTRVWLPYAAPLASITHVKYYDTTNTLTTLSSSVYTTAAFSEPACLTLVDGQVWPSVYVRDDAVQIEYVVGVSDVASVPPALVQAVQMLVGHWYANRENSVVGTIAADVPFAAEALCAPHRLFVRGPQW